MLLLSTIGVASISVALFILAELSRRLGRVTGAGPIFIAFYVSAFLVGCGAVVRLFFLLNIIDKLQNDTIQVILYNGLPAVGMTISVFAAWRYWSWLLAERG